MSQNDSPLWDKEDLLILNMVLSHQYTGVMIPVNSRKHMDPPIPITEPELLFVERVLGANRSVLEAYDSEELPELYSIFINGALSMIPHNTKAHQAEQPSARWYKDRVLGIISLRQKIADRQVV